MKASSSVFNFMQKYFIGACLTVSGPLSAAIYEMEFRGIAGPNGAALCETIMADISSRFAAASGASVLGVRCEKSVSFSNFMGRLSYLATTPVAIWNSDTSYLSRESEFYKSKESCDRGLASEVQLFRSLTGLTPFASYCMVTGNVGPSTYRTRLNAVGTTTFEKFEDHVTYVRETLDTHALTDELCRIGTNRGLRISQWGASSRAGSFTLMVGFYDDLKDGQKNELAQRGLLYFADEASCATEQAAMTTRWAQTILPTVFACTKAGHNGSQLTATWWGEEHAQYAVNADLLPQSFLSAADCQSEGRRVEGLLAAEGVKVLGSLCGHTSEDPREIRLEIYTR